ncbi:pyrroloquinoline quinone biosynthesis peptide chaperone PqqD [Rhodoblastus acidophilus]|uniref:Pyrroloquinoline quinone biosynthesis peptide chaperone PqqD n=1 Tax=Candidatus Rhodoblastus alkanivorans TaxID=2954117 RepID=A0ABS9Z5P0_9HYPH|nr:pyrroloquinoline quinone biosynthesis peptide chaperone PqqD [Candidatus Rhodoblastus alkanivorans]MCI4682695.1 pyrroloquinoline quinone biosynthesis peptide chaperone PqqD [Candidatus Rhodoblastus alkanivorans]MDI4640002.1 pyrroloquinoline quinone biosynthesis peptide chaperone PqqD [Rhodoblastus acidophilus]
MTSEQLTDDSRPHLLRGVKLKNDQVRKSWVLLAPERYLRLNAVSVDILQRCDGAAALSSIVDDLANKYGADRAMIERDVRGLLANLLEKRMLGL